MKTLDCTCRITNCYGSPSLEVRKKVVGKPYITAWRELYGFKDMWTNIFKIVRSPAFIHLIVFQSFKGRVLPIFICARARPCILPNVFLSYVNTAMFELVQVTSLVHLTFSDISIALR